MSAENLPYDVMVLIYRSLFLESGHVCTICHRVLLCDTRCRDISALQCTSRRWRIAWDRFALDMIAHNCLYCNDPVDCIQRYQRSRPSVPFLTVRGYPRALMRAGYPSML